MDTTETQISTHQHYGQSTSRQVRIGDEDTCAGCGESFTVGVVWVA